MAESFGCCERSSAIAVTVWPLPRVSVAFSCAALFAHVSCPVTAPVFKYWTKNSAPVLKPVLKPVLEPVLGSLVAAGQPDLLDGEAAIRGIRSAGNQDAWWASPA